MIARFFDWLGVLAGIMFLALCISQARAQQGNLPKPVQALPSYPPAVCVAPNWKPEPCEKRREQAEQDGWAEVAPTLSFGK